MVAGRGAGGAGAPPDAPERDQALSQALEAARAIGDEGTRAGRWAALAPHLTPPLLGPALEAARAIGSEGSRAGRWRRRRPT